MGFGYLLSICDYKMINIKPGTIITLPKNRSILICDKNSYISSYFLEKSKKVIFLTEEETYPNYSIIKILLDGKIKYTYYDLD